LRKPAIQKVQGNQQADTRDAGVVYGDSAACVQRLPTVASGGLLELHLGASQQAVADCTFAAIPVRYNQEETGIAFSIAVIAAADLISTFANHKDLDSCPPPLSATTTLPP
jgi:hypothetical protein